MARRKSKNTTGLVGTGLVDYQTIYRVFQCLNPKCKHIFEIPESEIENSNSPQEYVCPKCNTKHNSDLDIDNVPGYFKKFLEKTPKWKYCRVCERIQPLEMFDKHKRMRSGRQMECKSCKWVINQKLNPLRTKEQLKEGGEGRRLLEVFRGEEKVKLDVKKVKLDYQQKCFKCGVSLKNAKSGEYHIDHVLPAKYLWTFSDGVSLLCQKCNLEKSDKWPSEFYTRSQIKELSLITGIPYEILASKKPKINPKAMKMLKDKMDSIYKELADRPKDMKRLRKLILNVENIDILDFLKKYEKEKILKLLGS